MPTMRAMRFDRFGPADVLHVAHVEVPTPAGDQVLVRVRAAGVGGGEPLVRAGRMRRVMRLRPPAGAGNEFIGEIVSTGPKAERLRAGDAVWGMMPHLTVGSMADYVAVPENLVTLAPAGLDPVAAAALPASGTTTVTALEKAGLRNGERLLVRGASGGLGSLAVQLGKAIGAHVTALAGAGNLDWVDELGADATYDYRSVEPTRLGEFDVVFDSVGSDMPTYRRLVARKGRYVALAFDPDHLIASFGFIARGSIARRRRVVAFSNSPTVRELDRLRAHVEAGELRPQVDSVYALEELPDAHRRIEAGGIRGKLVVDLRRSS